MSNSLLPAQALQLPKPPKALEDDIDDKEYAKTKDYQIDKWLSPLACRPVPLLGKESEMLPR